MSVAHELLSNLCCPVTLEPLKIEGAFLISYNKAWRYPFVDGIPNLRKESLELLDADGFNLLTKRVELK